MDIDVIEKLRRAPPVNNVLLPGYQFQPDVKRATCAGPLPRPTYGVGTSGLGTSECCKQREHLELCQKREWWAHRQRSSQDQKAFRVKHEARLANLAAHPIQSRGQNPASDEVLCRAEQVRETRKTAETETRKLHMDSVSHRRLIVNRARTTQKRCARQLENQRLLRHDTCLLEFALSEPSVVIDKRAVGPKSRHPAISIELLDWKAAMVEQQRRDLESKLQWRKNIGQAEKEERRSYVVQLRREREVARVNSSLEAQAARRANFNAMKAGAAEWKRLGAMRGITPKPRLQCVQSA
jgi:hypothetical protein